MNIWIFNQYADSPDRHATAHYDLGKQLVARGHRVTIFASGFNHYNREEEHTERGSQYTVENYDGVRFVWLRTYPYRGNDWRRSLNMVTYGWQAVLVGRKMNESPGAVIGTCPQPFGALAGYLMAAKNHAPFFFEVRDLWPQTLVDSGGLSKKSPLYWLLAKLEKFLFRRSRMVLSVVPNIQGYVSRLGIPKERLVWIPNGADLSRYAGLRRLDQNDSNGFTAMYLGGLARYNGVEVILEAAKLLQGIGRHDIRFVISGDGPQKPALIEYTRASGLRNVEFRSPVPKADICNVMQEADVFIFHVRNLSVLKYGISSNKLCDYLASGRPVIFAANAANNPVEDALAGLTIPPEDPNAMAQAIIKLHSLPISERAQMGKNGIEYARKNLDIRLLAQRLENALSGTDPSKNLNESSPALSQLEEDVSGPMGS